MHNSTLFFRDGDPFWTLRDQVIPELSKRRNRILQIWSAGCSTGQEAYSLAMMTESHPALRDWKVTIHASDLEEPVLRQAEVGSYTASEVRWIPEPLLNRYFVRRGANFTAGPDVRRGVKFSMFDLSGQWPDSPQMDVIFARNVLIYVKNQEKVIQRIREKLAPDGYLFVGLGPLASPQLEDFWEGFSPRFSPKSCCFVRDDFPGSSEGRNS